MTESQTTLTGQNAEGRGLSLTSDHLQALPKRHIDQFLLAYVQHQRQFLKTYAPERKTGPTLCDRLRTDDLASLVNLSTPQDILVFGTPILRARVSTSYDAVTTKSHDTAKLQETFSKEPENRDQAEPPRKSHSDKLPTVTSKQSHKFAESRKSNGKSLKAPATGKEKSSQPNKRTRNVDENHNSDDEQADCRLADRRKRKRAKKDIMKPQVPNQEEQSDDREQYKKSKNQPKNVQAGFALMHGFSATNVGKNRLTLDPLFRNLGVFKKGKASTAAKVPRGRAVKQGGNQHIFSESKFLNSTRARPVSPIPTTLSSPSAGSKSPLKSCKDPSSSTEHNSVKDHKEKTGPINENTVRSPYNPEESIIWDIEKEDKPDTDTDPSVRQGTILVHVPLKLAPNQPSRGNRACTGGSNISVESPGERCASSSILNSPSLGPSESASQTLPRMSNPGDKNGTSKYFKPISDKPNIVQTDHAVSPGLEMLVEPVYEPLYMIDEESLGKQCNRVMGSGPVFANRDYPLETLAESDNLADNHNGGTLAEPPSTRPETRRTLDSCFWPSTAWDANDSLLGYHSSFYDARPDAWMDLDGTIDPEVFQADIQGDELTGGSLFIDDYAVMQSNLLSDSISEQLFEDRLCLTEDSHAVFPTEEPCLSEDQEISFYPDIYEIDDDPQSSDYGISPGSQACLDMNNFESPQSLISLNDLTQEDWTEDDDFYQGRYLLYGMSLQSQSVSGSRKISDVEAEVAGMLKKKHWLPQRL